MRVVGFSVTLALVAGAVAAAVAEGVADVLLLLDGTAAVPLVEAGAAAELVAAAEVAAPEVVVPPLALDFDDDEQAARDPASKAQAPSVTAARARSLVYRARE